MTEDQAKKHYENPFVITKIWRHKDYPLIEVGELVLDRWPDNYFAEVEQATFTPAHVVPGIGFSPDKFLQGRLLVYGDAQRYRLGVNYNQIPVNQAKHAVVKDYHRDGYMRTDGNYGRAPAYAPNSEGYWTATPEVMEPPLPIEDAMWRYDPASDPTDDCYHSGGDLYRIMNETEKEALIGNTARNIAPCSENIKYHHAVHCSWADPDYGTRITKALKLGLKKVKKLAKGNHDELVKATLPGGKFKTKTCEMNCACCKKPCIEQKYLDEMKQFFLNKKDGYWIKSSSHFNLPVSEDSFRR